MPETKLLEQIDRDTNKNIDFQELKKTLDEGFFDKETGKMPNAELVKQELQTREWSDQLKNTCDQTLLHVAEELMKKIQTNSVLSEQDIKLFKLSYKLGYIHLPNVSMMPPLLEGTNGTLSLGMKNIISILNPKYNAYPAMVKQEKPRSTNSSKAVVSAINKRMETTNMLLAPEQKRHQYETIIKLASAYLHYQQAHGEDTEAASKTLQEFIGICNKPGGMENMSSSELYVTVGHIFSGTLFDKNGVRDGIVSSMTDNSLWASTEKAKETTMRIVLSIRSLDQNDATLRSWLSGFTYESGEGIAEVLTDGVLHLRVREDQFSAVGAKEFNGTMQKLEGMITLDEKGSFSPDMQKLLALFPEIAPVDPKELLKNYTYTSGDGYGGSKTLDNPLSAENIAKGKRSQLLETYLAQMQIPVGNSPEIVKIRKEMTKALIKVFEKMQLAAAREKQKIKETLIAGYTREQKNVEKNIVEAKKLLKQKGVDENSATGTAYIKYFADQKTLYTDLLTGKSISLQGVDGNQATISIEQIAESQVKNYQSIYLAETLPKAMGSMVLQAYPAMINGIKDATQPLTSDEHAVRLIADIQGIGDYWSDKTTNTAVNVSKELVINVALIAVSGGIANIAAKSALAAVQKGAEMMNAVNVVAKVGKYSQVASRGLVASWRTSRALTIADLTVEGTAFHATNTTLNAARNGDADQLIQKLNPFGNYTVTETDGSGNPIDKKVSSSEDYLRSVVFMGVMKYFGGITNSVTQKIAGKKLEKLNTPALQDKLLANAITLPGEFVGMQGADVAVSLAFGENVKLAPEDLMQTLAMVVGLRIAHMGTGQLHALSKKIQDKTIVKGLEKGTPSDYEIKIVSFEKQQVKYQITDKETGKIIDVGVVSPEIMRTVKENKEKKNTPQEKKGERTPEANAQAEKIVQYSNEFSLKTSRVYKNFEGRMVEIDKTIAPGVRYEEYRQLKNRLEPMIGQEEALSANFENNKNKSDFVLEEIMLDGVFIVSVEGKEIYCQTPEIAAKKIAYEKKVLEMIEQKMKQLEQTDLHPNKIVGNINKMIDNFKELIKDPQKLYGEMIKLKQLIYTLKDKIDNVSFSRIMERYKALTEAYMKSPGLGKYTTDQIKKGYESGLKTHSYEKIQKLNLQLDGQRFIDRIDYTSGGNRDDAELNRGYDTNGDGAFKKFHETADFLREQAEKKVPINKEFIEYINYLCMRGKVEGTPEWTIGKYRDVDVGFVMGTAPTQETISQFSSIIPNGTFGKTWGVQGDRFRYPPSEEVAPMMADLFTWYHANENTMDPIELAATFQRKFVTIHPFANGNGRTSRLIMDYILQSKGLPPAAGLATTDEMSLTNDQWVRVVYDAVLSTGFIYEKGLLYGPGNDYLFNDPSNKDMSAYFENLGLKKVDKNNKTQPANEERGNDPEPEPEAEVEIEAEEIPIVEIEDVIVAIESHTPEQMISVNNFSKEKIETIVGRKIENAAQMERIQKVHDMNFEGELGRDGIMPPGLYVDENGKVETNFTDRQLVIKRQELMKDGMFTKQEANALLANYVCGNVMPIDLVVQFLGNKIANFFKNIDKNMTPQQAEERIAKISKFFEKLEKYSIKGDYVHVSSEIAEAIGDAFGPAGQFIEMLIDVLSKTNKVGAHGKMILYQIQDIVRLQIQGLDKQAVKANAQLPDMKRGDKGMEIAKAQGLQLSYYDEQILRDAIREAHPIGRGEMGRNGLRAEVYNYRNKQLWQKMQVLYKAIRKINEINRRQVISLDNSRILVKELLRRGICGEVR